MIKFKFILISLFFSLFLFGVKSASASCSDPNAGPIDSWTLSNGTYPASTTSVNYTVNFSYVLNNSIAFHYSLDGGAGVVMYSANMNTLSNNCSVSFNFSVPVTPGNHTLTVYATAIPSAILFGGNVNILSWSYTPVSFSILQPGGVCGIAHTSGATYANSQPPTSELCASGTPSAVSIYSTGGYWVWSCNSASCFAARNLTTGACGAAAGAPSKTVPSSNLCNSGNTATNGVGSGPSNWGWYCYNPIGIWCTAPYVLTPPADCGPAVNLSPSIAPTTGLCNSGTPSVVSNVGGYWTWKCNTSDTFTGTTWYMSPVTITTEDNCVASLTTANGLCGSAIGYRTSPPDDANLCAAGLATPIIASSYPMNGAPAQQWRWSCYGIGGGKAALYCTAAAPTVPVNGACRAYDGVVKNCSAFIYPSSEPNWGCVARPNPLSFPAPTSTGQLVKYVWNCASPIQNGGSTAICTESCCNSGAKAYTCINTMPDCNNKCGVNATGTSFCYEYNYCTNTAGTNPVNKNLCASLNGGKGCVAETTPCPVCNNDFNIGKWTEVSPK
jgi:hypothetical protein